jgi:hypothetical protein
MHALAIGFSPAYLAENADGIRRDWPRIPLPDSRKTLEASAVLGKQVAELLDTEADAPGVTSGKLEPFFRTVGILAKVGGGGLDPDAGDLAVTAGWGHAGKEGVTMPAKGRIVERPYDKAELEAITNAAEARGLSQKQALALLGSNTRDVYLNDKAYWKNVPVNVWEYYIGGYQVIKKWLSYREQELLGRALQADEAREVTGMVRRLAQIVLLQPALDVNYKTIKANTYSWPNTPNTKEILRTTVLPSLWRVAPYTSIIAVRQALTKVGYRVDDATLIQYLYSFVQNGLIFDAGRGWYSSLKVTIKLDPEPIAGLVSQVRQSFPLLRFAAWTTAQANPWLHHLIGQPVVFLDVEKDALGSVADYLEAENWKPILNPIGNAARRFSPHPKSVILRPLHSAAPDAPGGIAGPEQTLVELRLETNELGLMPVTEFQEMATRLALGGRLTVGTLLHYAQKRGLAASDLFKEQLTAVFSEFAIDRLKIITEDL